MTIMSHFEENHSEQSAATMNNSKLTFAKMTKQLKEIAALTPDAKVFTVKDGDFYVNPERVTSIHSDRGHFDHVALNDGDWYGDAFTVKELAKKFTSLSKKKTFLTKKGGQYSPSSWSTVYYGDGSDLSTHFVTRIDAVNKKVVYIHVSSVPEGADF
jgi:hypothetical protein